jgi:hypothetical protein
MMVYQGNEVRCPLCIIGRGSPVAGAQKGRLPTLRVAAPGCEMICQKRDKTAPAQVRRASMTVYQGEVKRYGLFLLTPEAVITSSISLDVEGVGRALLRFAPQGGTLGTNKKLPPTPGFADVEMWYWMDTWPYIVDMLRNEKPVYFVFNDANQAGSLHTGWEPTGEAE